MTKKMVLGPELSGILQRVGTYRVDPEEVAYIASGKGEPRNPSAVVASALIAGDLGVDRMDYLRRDSYMCGVSYGLYDLDRLVSTLMLASNPESDETTIALEAGGMHAAEGLLTARYFMFTQVYYHDIREVYDRHLVRFLARHLPGGRYPTSAEEYLRWDDVSVLSLVREVGLDDPDAAAILSRRHFGTSSIPSPRISVTIHSSQGI
jgi:uncharacterized protein